MGFIDKVTVKTYWFNLLSPDIQYLNVLWSEAHWWCNA